MNSAETITAQTDGGKVLRVEKNKEQLSWDFWGYMSPLWNNATKKGRAVFFLTPYAPVPRRSSPEWDMRSRDTGCPSRAGVLPSLSITEIYSAVYTLQSRNATTPNVAAAQIGHLEPGCCILTPLSIFQSVKLKFYDCERTSDEKYKVAVSSARFIRIGKQKGPAFNWGGLMAVMYVGHLVWNNLSSSNVPEWVFKGALV